MNAIFIDVSSLTPLQLDKTIKVAKSVLLEDEENTVIVFIGFGGMRTMTKHKLCNELGLNRFEVSSYMGMDKGVEVQEWINHHYNIKHVCVISNEEIMYPVEDYCIYYMPFFLKLRIKKMLSFSYENPMEDISKETCRKMF